MKAWLAAAALSVAGVGWATPTANEILRRALDLSSGVQDYTADVKLTHDLDGASEQSTTITVYFKRPDKVSVKSRSFVVVPRDALTFGNLSKRVEAGADVSLVGTKTVNGVPIYTLKIKPKEAGAQERVLVTVDGRRFTVEQMEVVQGQTPVATLVWQHALVEGRYWMPASIVCTLPRVAGVGTQPGGRATLTFRNYRVNTGLSDSLFQQAH
jgi:outer membrane lipoprotein-sorting protein